MYSTYIHLATSCSRSSPRDMFRPRFSDFVTLFLCGGHFCGDGQGRSKNYDQYLVYIYNACMHVFLCFVCCVDS